MIAVTISQQHVEAQGLTYSCVDPGGFETASFTVIKPQFEIKGGDDVLVTDGPTVAWHGRVEEPGKQIANGVLSYQVNAVGYGAELKENPFSMIYVNSDIQDFGPTSLQRKQSLLSSVWSPVDGTVENNSTATTGTLGIPAVRASVDGGWVAPKQPLCEAQWDAGFGNSITRVIGHWATGTNINIADPSWLLVIFLATDDSYTSFISTGDLITGVGANNGIVDLDGGGVIRRFFTFQLGYSVTPAGSAGTQYDAVLQNISMYGPHGLKVTTDGTLLPATASFSGYPRRGLLLSDIVADVVKRTTNFTKVIDSNDFLVTQAAYKVPTEAEIMIEDMRKLCGWHWGVWEPVSILADTPSFWFTPPPPRATAYVLLSDCDDLDVTETYSTQHNKIIVSYTDVTGTTNSVTITSPNPRIRNGKDHTLMVAMGPSTPAAAGAFAQFVLDLDQIDVRAAGSCKLPTKLSDGRPSHLIKAGRQKLKIVDFPFSGARVLDSYYNDTFRISRVSVTVTRGVASTQIEFDQGADLIEVLQSRLTQGNASIGF